MNNSSVKYLYSHKPTFASIEFQHYLMNGNHNYDSLPSKTVKMTNMSMDDAHFNVKDNVWTDYIDNDGYELDKVEIGNKTYDPDDINQSIDVENTDTVYVKYYYKMKKIKVKFYIDDNFESLTMNTGEKEDIIVASITKVKESVTEADALEAARLAEENETLAEGSEELSEDSDSEDN